MTKICYYVGVQKISNRSGNMNYLEAIPYYSAKLGSVIFVAILGIIAICLAVLPFKVIFSKSGEFAKESFGEKTLLTIFCAVLCYISLGGLYHWYYDLIGRGFYSWLGYTIISVACAAFFSRGLKKLFG